MSKALEATLIHASGNTFMSLAKEKSDVGNLLKRSALIYTLTETGQHDTVHAVKDVVKGHGGYTVVNPDDGDILFIVREDAHIMDAGGPLAVRAQPGPAREGGHGPRHNSWVRVRWEDEVLTHTGVHFVTAHPDHVHNTGDRRDEQYQQAELMGQQIVNMGQGHMLATGSGDINASIPHLKRMQGIFDKYSLTTTAEETGNDTPTHGDARLDYIWTFDEDKRLSVPSMRVLRGPKYQSDHDPVVATISIAPPRG